VTIILRLVELCEVCRYMTLKIYRSVLIIADDFTGANDTIAQFAKLGFSTITTLDIDIVPELMKKYDVVAVDTESRALDAEKAYKLLLSLGNKIKEYANQTVFYKKIDSTLRGNITSEIRGLYDALRPDLIVFAPAFPKQGRTTKEGILMVKGVPVEKTYFGKDMRTPVRSSVLSSYFKVDFKGSYHHTSLDALRAGRIIDDINSVKVMSFDVENDEDLKAIVQNIGKLDNKKIIWIGSAGLAENVAYYTIVGSQRGKPILMVVGSANDLVREQVRVFVEEFSARILTVKIDALINNFEEESKRLEDEVSKALVTSSDIVITISYSQEQIREGELMAQSLNIELSDFGLILAKRFGVLVSRLISHFGWNRFGGLFITGGDIAISTIKSLGVDTLELRGEIEPGLPILKFKDKNIVTKAGGFGTMETLIKIAARLKIER